MNNFTVKSFKHNYEVIFGSYINFIERELRPHDYFLIDSNICIKYPDLLNFNNIITVNCDENAKEYYNVGFIMEKLINLNFKKNNRLFCIGGGVLQDIASYVSLLLNRGVEWIYIPTTLLSQGDSCIGGKISINFKKYKNKIGFFYPPIKILIDDNFIKTLTDNDYFSGVGELLHYYILKDGNSLSFFKEMWEDRSNSDKLILRSLLIKKEIIEIDEFDNNERKILNYGHSFGHAIETITNYTIPHGIGVCYGMLLSNMISNKLGILSDEILIDLKKIIFNIILKTKYIFDIDDYNIKAFIDILQKDKKNDDDEINLILLKNIGEAFMFKIKPDALIRLFEK